MALIHHATLHPSKQERVESFLPSTSWGAGLGVISKLAEYRFDDPAGEVGVETILWSAGDGRLIQTPLTYRGAPLDGADRFLIGTTEHSVLGTRWVYDGCGDPVWAQTLAAAITTGARQAQMYFEDDGKRVEVPARMQVSGSGAPGTAAPDVSTVDEVRDDGETTVVDAGSVELQLFRVVATSPDPASTGDGGPGPAGDGYLTGRIGADGAELTLAVMRLR